MHMTPPFSRLGLKTDFDRFTPKVTDSRARDARDSGASAEGQPHWPVAALVGQEGPREHNRTAIKKIAFLIAFPRYTILSNQRNCMNHPSQRERQPSHKQSRRRCWCLLLSTTRLSGVGGGIIRSYNLKSTLLSSSMVVLLL